MRKDKPYGPIIDPVPGKEYFGFIGRCGHFIYMSEQSQKFLGSLEATTTDLIACPQCGVESKSDPSRWVATEAQ
jgi:hypothetical protein